MGHGLGSPQATSFLTMMEQLLVMDTGSKSKKAVVEWLKNYKDDTQQTFWYVGLNAISA